LLRRLGEGETKLTKGIDRNTTLCHPDANTGPNAIIEGPDIALERRNSRRSFHRHGRNKSYSGKITAEERMMYDHENASRVSAMSRSPLSPHP
jgi:hypothetical protein